MVLCYDYSGNVQNSVYTPCSLPSGDDVQPCCAFSDACLANKLCAGGSGLYRGGCTDSTFKASGCPQFCLSASTVGLRDCGNSTGCCDWANDDGCSCQPGAIGAVSIGASAVVALTIPSSSTTASSASSSTTVSSANGSSTGVSSATTTTSGPADAATAQGASPSSSSSTSATDPLLSVKIGIPVAVVLFAAILAAMWLFLRRRYRRQPPISTPIAQKDRYSMQNWSGVQTPKYDRILRELPTREPGELQSHSSELMS